MSLALYSDEVSYYSVELRPCSVQVAHYDLCAQDATRTEIVRNTYRTGMQLVRKLCATRTDHRRTDHRPIIIGSQIILRISCVLFFSIRK